MFPSDDGCVLRMTKCCDDLARRRTTKRQHVRTPTYTARHPRRWMRSGRQRGGGGDEAVLEEEEEEEGDVVWWCEGISCVGTTAYDVLPFIINCG
jgi:hypothetical protein